MGRNLTEFSPPLIIVHSPLVILRIGEGSIKRSASIASWRPVMRVSVYKLEGGGMSVLVESTPGKGRAPVMIPGVTLGNLVERVLPVVTQLRRPKGQVLDLPPL